MEGLRKIALLLFICVTLHNVSSVWQETRTGLQKIPEKIIGGVIEIVQNHKNKPGNQQQQGASQQGYQPQQYPQYQQWNPPNYQNPGYQPQQQGQFQVQGQYNGYNPQIPQSGSNYQPAPSYPQSGTYPVTPGPVYPSVPVQGSYGGSQSQTQTQGQHQVVYPPSQSSGQYQTQTQQQSGQYQGPIQQPSGQYQNQGQYTHPQAPGNQFQGQGQYVSPPQGPVAQGSGSSQLGSGQTSGGFQGSGSSQLGSGQTGGFQVSGGHQGVGGGQGPTCICQAWTKPQSEILHDAPTSTASPSKSENIIPKIEKRLLK